MIADAGVRRELILAFRNLPTDQAGDSLAKAGSSVGRAGPLVSRGTWDWRSRSERVIFCRRSLTAACMARSNSRKRATNGDVALPPYFPVDRNEAFIAAGTPDRPVSAVSKYLGLAWRIHRREVLPLHRADSAGPARCRAAAGRG